MSQITSKKATIFHNENIEFSFPFRYTKEVAFEGSETLEVQAMHNQIEIRMNKLCFLIGIPFY